MPITVFDTKGIPVTRRERIETAVVAAGRDLAGPYEAWIAADPFRGGFKVLITGPQGLERSAAFTIDEELAVVTARVRESLEE